MDEKTDIYEWSVDN